MKRMDTISSEAVIDDKVSMSSQLEASLKSAEMNDLQNVNTVNSQIKAEPQIDGGPLYWLPI